jgi:glycerol-3-phosphate acyltransferase PlsX
MIESGSGSNQCRIAVDAMGGDFAPENTVLGAVQAQLEKPHISVYLVGNQKSILDVITSQKLTFDKERIVHTEQVIEMSESPTFSIKTKPDSSLVVGAKLVKDKKTDAFVSAGNTGAMMAASTLIMGRIPGVGRPTIGAEMPSVKGICYLYDVAKEMWGVENPSIGVLSIGEEAGKGNEVSEEAVKLLKNSKLNFIGYVEGRDILEGKADVVVCDGFVGNIILKFGESIPGFLKYLLQQTAKKNFFDKFKIALTKSSLKKALKVLDYQEYGGVPLLGVNGISIIGHGSSTPKAIKNMVFRAYEIHTKNLLGKIESSIKQYSNLT